MTHTHQLFSIVIIQFSLKLPYFNYICEFSILFQGEDSNKKRISSFFGLFPILFFEYIYVNIYKKRTNHIKKPFLGVFWIWDFFAPLKRMCSQISTLRAQYAFKDSMIH